MKFELYKDVVLARDLPEHRLKRGDIVKPVEHHLALDGTEGYSAEVFSALGDTLTVITVPDAATARLCAGSRLLRSARKWKVSAKTAFTIFGDGL